MIICVDFDGTCVDHQYPDIGPEAPGAVRWVKRWTELGAKLILFTMRHDSESQGPVLSNAVAWFRYREIPLWGVNENPEQYKWSDSRKVYAHLYVDDAAFGCPLVGGFPGYKRPFVNWDIAGPQVETMLLKEIKAKQRPEIADPDPEC